MIPQHVISLLLQPSDAPIQEVYANNLDLLRKIILCSYVGRLRINGLPPDSQISLGNYLFDNERIMFDFSRLSPDKKELFLEWLLQSHQQEKQFLALNNVYVSDWRGLTAEEKLGWWDSLKHWFNGKQIEYWRIADFKLSTDYQMTGIEAFHGEHGLLFGFTQHLVPPSGSKYKSPHDLQAEPLGNTKRVILTDTLVDELTQNYFHSLDAADLCEKPHPQSIFVSDSKSRYEEMHAYRHIHQFSEIKPWYLRLWHWIRSWFIAAPPKIPSTSREQIERVKLYDKDQVKIFYYPSSNKVLVVEKKPNVEILTFCGGGPKIFTHIGVWKALEELDKKPKRFSGASAGAIMAMMCYLGYRAEEIQELFRDMREEHLVFLDIDRNGLSDSKSLKTALDFAMAKKLRELASKYRFPYPDGKITFQVLESIRQQYPDCGLGEELIVTSTNKNSGKTTYFSWKLTPNQELTQAIELSALMPVVYREIVIDGVSYNDGGISSNFPVEPFSDDGSTLLESEYGNNLKLVAIQINNGTEDETMYTILTRVYRENPVLNWIYSLLTGVDDPASGWEKDRLKLRKYALQTIVPNIDDIPMSGFSVEAESQDLMIQRGYDSATDYLQTRYGRKEAGKYVNCELMSTSFLSLTDLLSYCAYRGNQQWFDKVHMALEASVDLSDMTKDILYRHSKQLRDLYFQVDLGSKGKEPEQDEYEIQNPVTFFGNKLIENGPISGEIQSWLLTTFYGVFVKLSTKLVKDKHDKDALLRARHALSLHNPFACLDYFNKISQETHIILHIVIQFVKALQKNYNEIAAHEAMKIIEKLPFDKFKSLLTNCYAQWDLSYAQCHRVLTLFVNGDYAKVDELIDSLRIKEEPMQVVKSGLFMEDFDGDSMTLDLEENELILSL